MRTHAEITPLVDKAMREQIENELADWEQRQLAESTKCRPKSKDEYLTGSRRPAKRIYTPLTINAGHSRLPTYTL